jgi:hypothetical protein
MTSEDDIKGLVSFKFLRPCLALCLLCASELLMQVRRHLAILYKRFLCHQMGEEKAARLATRQAAALSALRQLTQRGAHPVQVCRLLLGRNNP